MLLNFHCFSSCFFLFFFNDTATTEIYTLSYTTLFRSGMAVDNTISDDAFRVRNGEHHGDSPRGDRKSTRLNSSHSQISYAVFYLKKKKKTNKILLITNNP